MAGRGPVPKRTQVTPADDARRQAEFTVLHPDGTQYGPELPDIMDWPEQTRSLWQALRTDAAARLWTEADWSYLLDTMLLSADLWSGNAKVAPEIRLRLAEFGVTPASRMRLRLLIDEQAAAPVSKLDEIRAKQQKTRRRRLTRLVDTPTSTKGTQ